MSKNSDRIIELFSQATAKKSVEEREQLLATACREEPELREQVESLLQSHDVAGGFLKNAMALPIPEPLTEKPGSVIGRYKLLQKIGEGGCGVVYMAEQEAPVRRRVALKIIKIGMDTRSVIARFEAERQALALMEHPNIAKVLDAGATETGRPYFVMELVRGVRITDFCDQNNLSTRQRLDLFVQVCQAIHHAHQKGIIHRDIKPSNILITLQDGVPAPVVIDFGIAKATQQQLTAKTLFTEFHQFLGTPAYMSPEQAELSRLDVDTRGDIYSLGVLLYELMTGKPPFDPEQLLHAGLDEMRRQIREEEPPRPSTRLSTLAAADLTAVAKLRQSEPPKLISLIRGDLDWIVMKALEKNRARRYASASEFAADIGRHFNDEPIIARPPSAAYRLQKFVRKRKGPVAAAGAIAATIVLLGSLSMWLGARAQQQAKKVRANSILVSAVAAQDPLLKAQLLLELADAHELPGRLNLARDAASSPLPTAVLRGHEWTMTYAAFMPDGKRVFTASRDGVARVWRVDGTGEPTVLRGQHYRAWALSPDGKLAVNGGNRNGAIAYVWRTDGTGEALALRTPEPIGENSVGESVAFSPDSARVLTWSWDGLVRVWRADGTGAPILLGRFKHAQGGRRLSFSPDGTQVLVGAGDQTVRIVHADGTGDRIILRGHEGVIRNAVFSPDGNFVATASDDKTARVWRADGTGEPAVLRGHEAPVRSAAFSPDGTHIVTASQDSTARIWRADESGLPITLRGHEGEVTRAVFSPDGSQVVTASGDGTARLWRADGQGGSIVLRGHDRTVTDVAFSRDGSRVVTASEDNTACVWQVDSMGEGLVLRGHKGSVWSIAFSPDGSRLVTASRDAGNARVWRLDGTGESIELPEERAPFASFNSDGTRVFTVARDLTVRAWGADGGGEPIVLRRFAQDDAVNHGGVAVSPDGTRLAAQFAKGMVRVWRTDATADPITWEGHGNSQAFLGSVAFSPDGKRLATATADTAIIWQADGTGTPVVLKGHLDEVFCAAFSPDGKLMVTSSTDGTARLWRTDDGQEIKVLRGHEKWVPSAAFSPDGMHVVTGGVDGTVRVWPVDGTEEPLVLRAGQPLKENSAGEWSMRLKDKQAVWSVAFSPDGARVAAGLNDGTVRVWRVNWPGLLSYLRAHVNASLTPEQRMKFLGESAAEARANHAETERRLGHKPQVHL